MTLASVSLKVNVRPLVRVAELSGPMVWSLTSTPAIEKLLILMGAWLGVPEPLFEVDGFAAAPLEPEVAAPETLAKWPLTCIDDRVRPPTAELTPCRALIEETLAGGSSARPMVLVTRSR